MARKQKTVKRKRIDPRLNDLLWKVSEEATELSHAAAKIALLGEEYVRKGKERNNVQKFMDELEDLDNALDKLMAYWNKK